jgi:hypothetical protein
MYVRYICAFNRLSQHNAFLTCVFNVRIKSAGSRPQPFDMKNAHSKRIVLGKEFKRANKKTHIHVSSVSFQVSSVSLAPHLPERLAGQEP